MKIFWGRLVSIEEIGPWSRAEVVRRPRKKPDKMIRANDMVKGIAPVVPIRPAVVPMALAA